MQQEVRTELGDVERIWSNYFPEETFSVEERRVKLLEELAEFFVTPQAQVVLSQVQVDDGICFLSIDFQQIRKLCSVEEFYAALEVAPKEALLCMGAAVQVALFLKQKNFPLEDTQKINIRMHNHPESSIMLKNLKAAYIGRLVSVHGTVVKVSCVRPLVVRMDFSCAKCGTTISRIFPDGKYSPPSNCIFHPCKSRTFTPIRSTARLFDFQKIRLQEMLKSGNHEEGRVPRTVECELTEDLVDSCIPGDVVTVVGIIKVINNYMDVGGGIVVNLSMCAKLKDFCLIIYTLPRLQLFLHNDAQRKLVVDLRCFIGIGVGCIYPVIWECDGNNSPAGSWALFTGYPDCLALIPHAHLTFSLDNQLNYEARLDSII